MRLSVIVESDEPLPDEADGANVTTITTWPPWLERRRSSIVGSARLAYSEDQMRDEHGRFSGNGVDSPAGGKGTKEEPFRVKSAELAQKLIHDGKYVEMPSDQVSVLLDRLAGVAREARAAGTKAPLYDLCKVSVPDTNMFCGGTKDIPRIEMPQLAGTALPGTAADALPKDARGETDITGALRDKLAADGVAMDDIAVPADTLRATQNELNGAKVAGMMTALHDGTLPPGRIFVSSDNYVVDGHHRWAATVGESYVGGQPLDMDVTRVDMPISELIGYVNNFASDLGMAQMQAALRARQGYSPDQEREQGRFSGPGGGVAKSEEVLLTRTEGGLTIEVTEHSLVHEGVSVSPYPEREVVIDSIDLLTVQDLDDFEVANADLLDQPDHYMGTWLNPDDQKVYLDVSIVMPSREAADAVGREHGQYASYDLKTGETYPIESGRAQAAGVQAATEASRGVAPEGVDPRAEAGAHRRPEGPSDAQVTRAIARLHKLRENLGRKLLAGAEVAFAEVLRRAGVKVATRARSRGTSKTVQAQVRSVLAAGEPLRPVLAALGLKEQDLIAGGFTSYEEQADAWLDDYRKRQRSTLVSLGVDPTDYGLDDETSSATASKVAGVGVIIAGLSALARGRLLGGVDHVMSVGEVTGLVPARLVLQGIPVAEGRATATLGETLDDMPLVSMLPSAESIEEGLAGLVEGQTTYTWVHAMYGDPLNVFEPHEDLGISAFTTTDPDTDPDLANPDSFPLTDYYQNNDSAGGADHEGCTCGWLVNPS